MAAMTSPHRDGVSVEQKEVVKMASAGEEQPPTSNGVNGHPSPIATPPESTLGTNAIQKPNSIADAPVTEQAELNHATNHDAFTSNQLISEEEPSAVGNAAPIEAKPVEAELVASDPLIASEAPAALADDLPVAEAPKVEEALPSAEPAVKDTATELKLVDPQPDVEMSDAQPQPEFSNAEPLAESTQITQVSDVLAASPTEDLNLHPASMSSLVIDASQDEPSAPVTADTSMADAPSQGSVKVAREREEDDDMDEPLAKRTKTFESEAAVEQPLVPATGEMEAPVQEAADEMVVDQAPVAAPPRERKQGEPGTLGDPAQESQPITVWANREIRKVLASVKKTKAGGLFKDPVKVKWPELWAAYVAKITHPVDITAMEQTLRQDKYPTLGDFINEVYLIRENAHVFNGPGHVVTTQAMSLVENIFTRLADLKAKEPPKPERKEPKQIATRHAEPRAAATQARRESRGAAASPTEEIAESPVYAIPASGVPIIRRESTKNDGDRPKRPIHPPKSKDLGYEPKNLKKKKMSPEFRFCDEVLKELVKNKHWEINQWFLKPVDPVRDSAPTYHKVIKKPMDLATMQEKLNMGEYNSTKDFENDFQLIIKNCRKFNGTAAPSPAAGQLEELFKQKWAEKDEWMQSHSQAPAAPAAATSPSGAAKDDSEDEAEASEPEPEEEGASEISEKLQALTARWNEETVRLTQLVMAKVPDQTQIETQNTIIAMFMKEILEEKARLAAQPSKKAKKPAKPKQAKPKKAAAAAGAGGSKKATAGGAGGKKTSAAARKNAKRVMGQEEKGVVAEGINSLEGNQLERAIEIIKRDTNQEESDNGELELDIDQLSQDALGKLYDLVVKAFPSRKTARDKAQAPPAPEPDEEPARQLPKASKPKKHKPMGKAEQERSIEKLREIKAQFQRPGSGSQEPLPSVEGTQPTREDSDESEADSEED